QDAVLARAPQIHLHSVASLERGDQLAHVLLRHRRIHVHHRLRPGRRAEQEKKNRDSPYFSQIAHLFCVMVSSSAGCPAFTLAIARLSAGATSAGWSIGPSAYQPIDFARAAKSGAGSSMSMPM